MSTEFQIFISSTVDDLKGIRKKLAAHTLLSPPIQGIPLRAKVGHKVLECRIKRLLPIHILGNLSVIDPVALYNYILHTRGISN